ncbi:MAG TPA: nucleotidyltransferase domain-containing protein [Verrucomicrobiae bacterium]|jgi:predicted nucleotidyltransferase|nr:nucleotidyltransferase domain-containing protein [Verrucomicrobiae bacterium]
MNTAVSNDVNHRLADWSENFARALGDALQSIVLFGGLAKGEFVPEQSDVNVLIVFRTVTRPVLDRAAPLIRQGVLEFRLATMLVTEADLRDSADVFPIKYQDMQRHHKVLWGEDPFPKVTIAREHVRLRCEQELRNLSLRLRQSYIQRLDRPELLQAALNRAVSTLLVNLGVLLELKTGKPAQTKQDVLAKAAQLGIPLEPVREAWAVKRGEVKPDADGLRNLFASFMDAVQQSADLADKLP